MHLIMLLSGLGLAWCLRCSGLSQERAEWSERWQHALIEFLFPPLLLLTTAIAVLWMGPYGQMVWAGEGWLSFGLASGFLTVAVAWWLKLFGEGQITLQQVRSQPRTEIKGRSFRFLDLPTPYSAQVGFWQPELVISRGLLEILDNDHLEAVLLHEQAHHFYRDTFWFFWLGWIRRLTAWLPQNECIWQELLVLREMRADQWAAQYTDNLLLAETLLLVVRTSPELPENFCAAFSCIAVNDRLSQRIEALLVEEKPVSQPSGWAWVWLLFALLPLLAIPLHN